MQNMLSKKSGHTDRVKNRDKTSELIHHIFTNSGLYAFNHYQSFYN